MGGEVVLGSDCHDRALLNYGFDAMTALLREEGFAGVYEMGGVGEPMFVKRRL